MLHHLMVPLDGSELAERALPAAVRLAALTGTTIHLVYSVEPPPDPSRMVWAPDLVGMSIGIYDDLMAVETRDATVYLNKIHAQVTAAGVQAQAVTLTGPAAAALMGYERAAGIDLVVMCNHGCNDLARFASGSVADRLLRHGTAPLLLVRTAGAPVALGRAVVPLDGSARAEVALHVVEGLARDVVREVTLLRVIEAPGQRPAAKRYLSAVAQQLRPADLACQCRVEDGDPATAILKAAGTTGLVVMATHGRSGLTRWTLGSVADRVTRGGAAGVLLVRVHAEAQLQRQERSRHMAGSGVLGREGR